MEQQQEKSGFRVKVQHFGSFLSGMIMPNIGAFIAWGLITALFIPTGRIPNAEFAKLVDPMIKYLLPLLIAYTGGKLVYETRGGVVGAAVTMGAIVGTSMPMLLGAMILGPFSAWLIKRFDKLIEGKIKAGFEMLVNNFSAGILAGTLAIISLKTIGPALQTVNQAMASGVQFLIDNHLLPLVSIFVEPAKVLFLNNAINQGVLSPLGIDQAVSTGKSILFLIETNPGPGLGILLAYTVFGKGTARQTAPGAIIIQFLGGIHEIYFPYVLMKPALLLGAIAGGMTGIITFNLFDVGLVATASPGSIFAILALTPQGDYIGIIAGILFATIVSFTVSAVVLKTSKETDDAELRTAEQKMATMKGKKAMVASAVVGTTDAELAADGIPVGTRKIIFACDAGMGSSAMGASVLRNKVKKAGLDIEVVNFAIAQLPPDADIVVTHQDLTARATEKLPKAYHISVDNFLNSHKYDELVQNLADQK
ncbi:PTS mannitol transporter subunit IIBC [Listeria newyorkensis]|uniref:PTS system mannitol-specific EIICB component n=1 Tax=Listeria newyorkensis TaxID=1497681 RepID=A0ABX4XRG1_9LIST|nr:MULTISPECIES: PTS mannitol transporter subunit IICBA [Listeria]KGL39667.1 PTS system mannitol-specific transporter subunit IIBC [Listeriaceae bacterium FSL A5-0209]KGL43995.1 PTS system mannitol-specific transporter subunit IIBC [Listeria newyorkensis]PNP94875.1 PTS mannitol transporter subunit IIBC [Listeria newyorkensis]RQW67209.1 PTS mannitol transporter subunit IICBA [Listeria sp. SHR_NRA_18]WAO21824.1 PTS mannitol transporter subunit IICBA [Listeria newyorkensis]